MPIHFLDLIAPSRRTNVMPEVLELLRKCAKEIPVKQDDRLTWYTQTCYDAGVINHFQKYCIDYYSERGE